jgi:hypothetical protein
MSRLSNGNRLAAKGRIINDPLTDSQTEDFRRSEERPLDLILRRSCRQPNLMKAGLWSIR